MLARCALDLYWMARYLARAQHLCRLLQLQIESLADRSVREIHYGWARIYLCLGRMPPVGGLEFDSDDDFTLADSYTLAGDLTFERLNPASRMRARPATTSAVKCGSVSTKPSCASAIET